MRQLSKISKKDYHLLAQRITELLKTPRLARSLFLVDSPRSGLTECLILTGEDVIVLKSGNIHCKIHSNQKLPIHYLKCMELQVTTENWQSASGSRPSGYAIPSASNYLAGSKRAKAVARRAVLVIVYWPGDAPHRNRYPRSHWSRKPCIRCLTSLQLLSSCKSIRNF